MISKKYYYLITILIVLFFSQVGIAQSIHSNNPSCHDKLYTDELKTIDIDLNKENVNYIARLKSLKNLFAMQARIQYCIDQDKKIFNAIKSALQEFDVVSTQTTLPTYIELKNKKLYYLLQVESLESLKYQVEKSLIVAKEKADAANYFNLQTKLTPAVWELDFKLITQTIIHSSLWYKQIGIEQLNQVSQVILLILFILGLGSAIYFRVKKSKWRIWQSLNSAYIFLLPLLLDCLYLNYLFYPSLPIFLGLVNTLVVYFLARFFIALVLIIKVDGRLWTRANNAFITLLLAGTVFYNWAVTPFLYQSRLPPLGIVQLIYLLFIVTFIKSLLLFFSQKRSEPDDRIIKTMIKRIRMIVALILCYHAVKLSIMDANNSLQLIELNKMLVAVLLNVLYLSVIYPMFQLSFLQNNLSKTGLKAAKIFINCTIGVVILFSLNGYLHLAIWLVPNVYITIIMALVLKDVTLFLSKLHVSLSDPRKKLSRKFRAWLGVGDYNKLFELFFIRVAANIPIAFIIAFALMELWGTSLAYMSEALIHIETGTKIGNAVIHIPRLIRGVAIFAFILLLTRALSNYLIQTNAQQMQEKHSRVMLSALLQYMAFIMGSFVALFVAGIPFSSIVFLSGALSIGIGFGLQHFVGDFVSGLVLIINKPIKIGDRVRINTKDMNVEGFIKNIRSLSTQIQTHQHTDVIISNSTLIATPIVNYTFHNNKFYLIKMSFVLKDFQDYEKAKSVLFRIVKKHKDVIQEHPNQPNVYFEADQLILWCFIYNINEQHRVMSELNEAILIALKKKNISVMPGESSS